MSSRKYTPCIDLEEMLGDPSKIDRSKPVVFNWKAKTLAEALFLGVCASNTPLELAKQVCLVVGTTYIAHLDEQISNGRARNAPAGSAKSVSETKSSFAKEMDEAGEAEAGQTAESVPDEAAGKAS